MKTLMQDNVEISTDGYTVWVHDVEKGPVARHTSRLSEIHGKDFGTWSWDQFRDMVRNHVKVEIPEDFMFAEPEYGGEFGRVMRVSVTKLKEECNPLLKYPETWQIQNVTPEDFRRAILEAKWQGRHVKQPFRPVPPHRWGLKDHAGRIAYLMRTKWKYPLELAFDGEAIIVSEGNHRLAAAIMRWDKTLRAVVISNHPEDRRVIWERLRPVKR